MPRRRGVVAVIVREKRFLVIRRSAYVRAPRMFCFPGGHVENGESEEEALAREMREELHAIVEPVKPVWRYVTSWGVDLTWWLATLPGKVEPVANPSEVEEIRWLLPGEIKELPELLESNRQFVEALERGELSIEQGKMAQ
jgi:8-oxo-dGTP pyrophosphatase MutT (NUDIX family)